MTDGSTILRFDEENTSPSPPAESAVDEVTDVGNEIAVVDTDAEGGVVEFVTAFRLGADEDFGVSDLMTAFTDTGASFADTGVFGVLTADLVMGPDFVEETAAVGVLGTIALPDLIALENFFCGGGRSTSCKIISNCKLEKM